MININTAHKHIKCEMLNASTSTFILSEPCLAGSYKSAAMTACQHCEVGTVSSISGAVICTTCDPGKQPNLDRTRCGEILYSLELDFGLI